MNMGYPNLNTNLKLNFDALLSYSVDFVGKIIPNIASATFFYSLMFLENIEKLDGMIFLSVQHSR